MSTSRVAHIVCFVDADYVNHALVSLPRLIRKLIGCFPIRQVPPALGSA